MATKAAPQPPNTKVKNAIDHLRESLPATLSKAFSDIYSSTAITVKKPANAFIKMDNLGKSSNFEAARIFAGHYDNDDVLAYLPRESLCNNSAYTITLMRCDPATEKPAAILKWTDDGEWKLVFPLNLLRDGPIYNQKANAKQVKAILTFYFAAAGIDTNLIFRKSWEEEIHGALGYMTKHPLRFHRAKKRHLAGFGDLSKPSSTNEGTFTPTKTSPVDVVLRADGGVAATDQNQGSAVLGITSGGSPQTRTHIREDVALGGAGGHFAQRPGPFRTPSDWAELKSRLADINTFIHRDYPATLGFNANIESCTRIKGAYRILVGTQDVALIYVLYKPFGEPDGTSEMYGIVRRFNNEEKLAVNAEVIDYSPLPVFLGLDLEGLKTLVRFLLLTFLCGKGRGRIDGPDTLMFETLIERLRKGYLSGEQMRCARSNNKTTQDDCAPPPEVSYDPTIRFGETADTRSIPSEAALFSQCFQQHGPIASTDMAASNQQAIHEISPPHHSVNIDKEHNSVLPRPVHCRSPATTANRHRLKFTSPSRSIFDPQKRSKPGVEQPASSRSVQPRRLQGSSNLSRRHAQRPIHIDNRSGDALESTHK